MVKTKKIRVVIMPSIVSILEMKKRIKKADLFGAMYKIGESAGNDFFEYFIKNVKNRKNKIRKIFEVLNSANYGKYELNYMSENLIVIKLKQSSLLKLCSENKTASYCWICHWMSGFLSGLFDNPEGKWMFEKSRCKRLGHASCEFSGKLIK